MNYLCTAICALSVAICVFSVKCRNLLKICQNGAILSICRVGAHGKGLCRAKDHGKACTWRPPVQPGNVVLTIWSICRAKDHGKGANICRAPIITA